MSHSTRRFEGSDILSDLGYPFYRRLFDSESDFVIEIERTLAKARMSDPVELYLSRGLSIGVLSGGLTCVVGLVIGYVLFALGVVPVGTLLGVPVRDPAMIELLDTLKVPALIGFTGLVLGAFGFAAAFGTFLLVPYSRVSARRREINMLLPDAVSFMYALSVGGLNQLEIIEAMARADDTYGEVAREFTTIVQETEYFDTDYRTAIRQQAFETPSEELAQFLTDMLSIINSGGSMESFLDDKKDKHMRTAKQQQELSLETLELFGEMYMTLSLFPLLLIIVLVIMSMLGEADPFMLYVTVYGLIPMVGAGFLVLLATVKQDELGSGHLQLDDRGDREPGKEGLFSLGAIERFTGEYSLFDRIKGREGTHQTLELLSAPHHFLRDHPLFTLGLTVPAAIVLVGLSVARGTAPTSFDAMTAKPLWGTFVYVYLPAYLTLVPLMIFYEWNVRARRSVVVNLSDDLRKLSSANDTGLTLLESVHTVARTSTGTLAREFNVIYTKVQYGMSLRAALIEFNNQYHIPRLARTVKLISKAQEASSQITQVLTTAAQASENQDDIERERRSRTRMQVVIILMTYLTLLGVMAILKTQFLDVMAELTGSGGGGGSFGGNVDTAMLRTLFFHAVTMQAVLSGVICGYIRDGSLLSGLKFVVGLLTIALFMWMLVG